MFNPSEVRIEVSTLCNAKCVFCPHGDDTFTRKKRTMSFSDFKKYLDQVIKFKPTISDITFSGFGEILLDKDLIRKLEHAKDLGLKIHLLSNLSLANVEILDKISKIGIEDLRVSLHTSDGDKYSSIMVFNSSNYNYEKTINNIETALNKGIKVILTAVSIEGLNKDMKCLISKYSDYIELDIWKPHNWVYGKNYRSSNKVKNKTCGRPFSGPLEILVDGRVNMCCFDFNSEMTLGDMNSNTLKEIFTSSKFTDIQNNHLIGVHGNTICSKCDQLYPNKKGVLLYSNRGIERENKTSTGLKKIT